MRILHVHTDLVGGGIERMILTLAVQQARGGQGEAPLGPVCDSASAQEQSDDSGEENLYDSKEECFYNSKEAHFYKDKEAQQHRSREEIFSDSVEAQSQISKEAFGYDSGEERTAHASIAPSKVGLCWCPTHHPEPSAATQEALQQSGLALYRIPPPFLSPSYPWRLARLIRRFRPDILHLHGATVGIIGGLLGRWLRIPAIIYTEHLQYDAYARWLQRCREYAAGWPHWTVFVSQQAYRQAVEEGPLRRLQGRASVIHNGIDLTPYRERPSVAERVRWRKALGLPPDRPLVGCVGLLWAAKGQEYLIRAGAELKRRGQALTLVFVGRGEEEERLRQLTAELGLKDETYFLGWRDDVPHILGALDLYVQPSRTEGLPLAVVEAAAAGLPIVATRVGGIPEIIEDEKNGLLVPPANPAVLAKALARLLGDPALAHRLGEQARRTAFTRFSAEAMAAQYAALYQQLLARRL